MKLSICIPTYNRARFIGAAIESVIAQATDEVEIAISDNGSTDETPAIVAEFQKRFPRIHYSRLDQNVGYDRNLARVIELAAGDYCWFLGSDDRISPGGIATVLRAIDTYPDLGGMCVCTIAYNLDMTRRERRWNPTNGKYHQDKLFESADECFAVLGHYFGQFSGQIVNRRVCVEVLQADEWERLCNGWIHVYLAGAVLKKTQRWLFVYEECVDHRYENVDDPALLAMSGLQLTRFHIEGYDEVLTALLGRGSRTYRAVNNTGISYQTTAMVAYAKINDHMNYTQSLEMFKLFYPHYASYPIFWLKPVPLLLMPAPLIQFLRSIYRRYRDARRQLAEPRQRQA